MGCDSQSSETPDMIHSLRLTFTSMFTEPYTYVVLCVVILLHCLLKKGCCLISVLFSQLFPVFSPVSEGMGVYKIIHWRRADGPVWLQAATAHGIPRGKYYSDAPLPPTSVPRVIVSVELRQRYETTGFLFSYRLLSQH